MAEQAEQWWEQNEYYCLLHSLRKQQGWGTPCSSRVGGNGASEDSLYPFRPITIFQSTQVFAKWTDPRHLWHLSVSWTLDSCWWTRVCGPAGGRYVCDGTAMGLKYTPALPQAPWESTSLSGCLVQDLRSMKDFEMFVMCVQGAQWQANGCQVTNDILKTTSDQSTFRSITILWDIAVFSTILSQSSYKSSAKMWGHSSQVDSLWEGSWTGTFCWACFPGTPSNVLWGC